MAIETNDMRSKNADRLRSNINARSKSIFAT